MVIVRPHLRTDADRIAGILAAGWATAYASFMPEELLAPRIDVAHRQAEIADWLDHEFDPTAEAIFVAGRDRVDGFIHMELGDKGGLGGTGIVNLLYVDPAAQRQGLGRALMAAGAKWLLATAPGPLALSAYERNPCRHAYRAMGGEEAGRVVSQLGGYELAAVLYLWRDPRDLVP